MSVRNPKPRREGILHLRHSVLDAVTVYCQLNGLSRPPFVEKVLAKAVNFTIPPEELAEAKRPTKQITHGEYEHLLQKVRDAEALKEQIRQLEAEVAHWRAEADRREDAEYEARGLRILRKKTSADTITSLSAKEPR